jgi:hypothetical protein
MDEKKLIILEQGHECLYNLQHKDYNNLVKDSSWKETAGELHAQDKELSRRIRHCRRMAGERHVMCESAFNIICHFIIKNDPVENLTLYMG